MMATAGRRAAFLHEIGVGPLWQQRAAAPQQPAQDVPLVLPPATAATDAVCDTLAAMDWQQLQSAAASCTRCQLCRSRTHAVFGSGGLRANWLFVGEGPGQREDAMGEPFVGHSGKLLDNMLLAMGLARGSNVYLANSVKCRPVGADGEDRAPTAEEVAACHPYLERQIALIQPAIIVALGKTAALALLKLEPQASLQSLRGTVHRYASPQHASIPLIVTYHPAYLLRQPADKGKAWADLCLALQTHAAS